MYSCMYVCMYVFLIYINSLNRLCDLLRPVHVHMYADESQCMKDINSVNACKSLQSDLVQITVNRSEDWNMLGFQ